MISRKKPGVAFLAIVVLVVAPLLYVLSFGPACWVTMRLNLPSEVINVGYHPIVWSFDRVPREIRDFVMWYSEVGDNGDGEAVWYCGTSESDYIFRPCAKWRR